jgi:hypothetical protein
MVTAPVLEYATYETAHVSRLARYLGQMLAPVLFVAIIFAVFVLAPSLGHLGKMESLPPYTLGLTFLPLDGAILGLGLSFLALYRIRRSCGRLVGVGYARKAIVIWGLACAAFFALHLAMEYDKRAAAVAFNVRACRHLSWPGYPYPSTDHVPGCDYLVPGLALPTGAPGPANLVVVIESAPDLIGRRWVYFANDTVQHVSYSDLPGVLSANNAARAALGLGPWPVP